MRLQNIYIRRSYANDELTGSVEYENNAGKMTINLTEDEANAVTALLSVVLQRNATELAKSMTAHCITLDSTPILEN